MRHKPFVLCLALSLALVLAIGRVFAHMTPPVVLISDRDVVLGMMEGAKKYFVREVRLTPEERTTIQQQWGWRAEDELYRFYLGRDEAGQLVAAVTFLTEFTIHGPVRVAVGLSPDGRIKDAQVVELTEETFPWLKPLIDQNFTQDYVGQDSQVHFALSERALQTHLESMPLFYGQLVVSLVQRAAILFDVTMLRRPGKL